MEAHKERAEQVEREEAEEKRITVTVTGLPDSSSSCDVDANIPKKVIMAGEGNKIYEDVIRKAVTGGEDGGKVVNSPEDLLVWSRSVDKIDSSLQ